MFKLGWYRLGLLGALNIVNTLQGEFGAVENVTNPFTYTKSVNLASDYSGMATALLVDETTSTLRASTFSGEWQADNLSTPFDTSDDTDMAMDGEGNLLAVWTQVVGGKREVHVSEKPLGGNWIMPLTLSESERDCFNPRLVSTPSGEVTVTWNQGSNTYIERISGIWGTPLPLPTATSDFSYPQIVCDPSGRVVAVWIDGGRIAVCQKVGGVWQVTPDLLSPAGKKVEHPQLTIDQAGNATCTWVQEGQIASSTQEAEGSWSMPQLLLSTGSVISKPVLVTDSMGNITLFARSSNRLEAFYKPSLSNWEPYSHVLAEGGDNLVAGVDAEGNILSAWITPTNKLQAKIKPVNANWPKNAMTLATEPIANLTSLKTASVHTLLWDNPILHNIQSVTVFQEPEVAEIISKEEEPEVAEIISREEEPEAHEPSHEIEKKKEHPKKTEIKTPQVRAPIRAVGAQRKIRFLSQTSLVNVITWRPPAHGPRPKFYKIYRNSGLTNLAVKLSSYGPLVFNDHQRKRNTVYTYYIVAVDALGNTSEPAVVTVYPE